MRIIQLASTATLLIGVASIGVGRAAAPAAQDVVGGGAYPGARTDLGISLNPAANTAGQGTIIGSPDPAATVPPPPFGLFPRTGRTLSQEGIDIHGTIIDHFLANPSAGAVPGHTSNLGVVLPTVDIDLGKLLGIPGGTLHVAEAVAFGRSNQSGHIAELGGILTGYQNATVVLQNTLSELTYEQHFLGDKLEIEAGRSNPFRYFLIPNSLDVFSDASQVFAVTSDTPAFPFASWGGRVAYHLTPSWYAQAAAFEDNLRQATEKGYNLGDAGASGVVTMAEIAYRSEFDTERFPANLELGLEYNTRHGYSNAKDSRIAASPFTTAANYPGGGSIFFQGSKVVWRGAQASPSTPPKNIAIFGSIDPSFDKPQPLDLDARIGLNLTGFVPGRPLDIFEAEIRYQRLSHVEADFETSTARQFGYVGAPIPRDGGSLELAYQIQVTRWGTLTPFGEYVTGPDAYYDPFQGVRPRDGFLTGILATIAIGPLLGTSHKPF